MTKNVLFQTPQMKSQFHTKQCLLPPKSKNYPMCTTTKTSKISNSKEAVFSPTSASETQSTYSGTGTSTKTSNIRATSMELRRSDQYWKKLKRTSAKNGTCGKEYTVGFQQMSRNSMISKLVLHSINRSATIPDPIDFYLYLKPVGDEKKGKKKKKSASSEPKEKKKEEPKKEESKKEASKKEEPKKEASKKEEPKKKVSKKEEPKKKKEKTEDAKKSGAPVSISPFKTKDDVKQFVEKNIDKYSDDQVFTMKAKKGTKEKTFAEILKSYKKYFPDADLEKMKSGKKKEKSDGKESKSKKKKEESGKKKEEKSNEVIIPAFKTKEDVKKFVEANRDKYSNDQIIKMKTKKGIKEKTFADILKSYKKFYPDAK